MARSLPDTGRTFVVRVETDGSRFIAEVFGADVSITTEPAYPWSSAALHTVSPVRTTIDLHGYLDTWTVYAGDVPEPESEQRAIALPTAAVEA